MIRKLKCFIGVLIFDARRYEKALFNSKRRNEDWLRLHNRAESISMEPNGQGIKCNWRWSSELHAPKIVPAWGRRLMKKALAHYPIVIENQNIPPLKEGEPEVSFIIGHRGKDRLPLLQLTLKSIANQGACSCECIVVEESITKEIEHTLPAWVTYIHLATESETQPYNRSRTFNEGAKVAKGKLLVFHDNDMLVPASYAAELLRQLNAGFEVINLKRFIFYLTESHTRDVIRSGRISFRAPDFVLQNSTGGGSLAVEENAYFDIGGFDEDFVGWGGEDVEFWDRAQTLKVYSYAYLPLVHLWHAPQPDKTPQKDSAAMRRLEEVLAIDPSIRIADLKKVNSLTPAESKCPTGSAPSTVV
jgi:hypothetical protein